MSRFSTGTGIVDATKGLPCYAVVDADYADDAFPPMPFRVLARYCTAAPAEPWARDEEEAACVWAEHVWTDHDYPDELTAIVTAPDGRRYRVEVRVEAVPSFTGRSTEVTP